MTILSVPDDSLFGPDNLPYGVFSVAGQSPRVGVRIGEAVLDLARVLDDDVFDRPALNPFMAQGPKRWAQVRRAVQDLFGSEVSDERLYRLDEVALHLPVEVADYVDFYASEQHATHLGELFRPGQPALKPNWKHLPVSYHGRAGTVVVSGTDIRRPQGQRKGDERSGESGPVFGPSTRLDIECEVGFVVGAGSVLGSPVATADFDRHVFGAVIFNDWSARDIQAWEYVPLGPHLGKSFASTISPWVVPMAALDAARVPTPDQGQKLPYLAMEQPWGLDIDLSVVWNGQEVSRPRYRDVYWSPAQMLAHLTINGASLRTGDLYASGTVSGDEPGTYGSLIELTRAGAEPATIAGEERSFLADGDEVIITASAVGPHGHRIGFGSCRGRILPVGK